MNTFDIIEHESQQTDQEESSPHNALMYSQGELISLRQILRNLNLTLTSSSSLYEREFLKRGLNSALDSLSQ